MSGIEFVFAAVAAVLTVCLFTGALDPFPRPCIALMAIALASLAAAGIYARFARDTKDPKTQLIVVLLFCLGFFVGGVGGAIYPRDSRVGTPYFSGAYALASAVFAGYWIRRYIKLTRP